MIEPASHLALRQTITTSILADRGLLDSLRAEIRPLRDAVRRIQPRTGSAVSLVGTDGGNNRLEYDPFVVQLVRVVDSSNNEYCLEALTPTLPIEEVSRRQFDGQGRPVTALGRMMQFLGVHRLEELARFIALNADGTAISSGWVREYRELVEWAILFALVRERSFGTDTLIVVDGPMRGDEPAGTGPRPAVLAGFEETDILGFGGRLEQVALDAGAAVPLTFIPAFPIYPPEFSWMRSADSGQPALVLREASGGGRVAYLAADIDWLYGRYHLPDHGRLLENLVRWAAQVRIPLRVEGAGSCAAASGQPERRRLCPHG